MKNKPFDCVEMKREAAAKIQAMLEKMMPEEETAYWDRRNKELRAEMEAAKAMRKAS